MLKKKFGMIVLMLITTVALTLPVVRAAETDTDTSENQATSVEQTTTDTTVSADDETSATSEEAINTESEETTSENTTTTDEETTTSTEENFKQSDVYLTGDNITIDYIVDGNLFIFADTVTINSQIGGDAFIFANTVTVGEQGYVFSNLFTIANTVNIQGVVYDLYTLSNTVNITSYVYRDIKVSTDTLNIYGTVGRNAFVNCNNMNFTQDGTNETEETTTLSSQGMINGNLEYSSKSEITIPDGTVTGEVKYNQIKTTNTKAIQTYLISLGTIIATAILIWLICLWLAPKFVKKSNLIDKKSILPEIGLGIITPIILVLVSFVLILLSITSSFGLLLLATSFILVGLSTSIFIIAINNLVCNKLKIQKTIGNFGMLIVTAAVLWLIGLIPVVGSIVGIIAVIIGLGILVYYLIKKEKTDKDKKAKETK